MSIIYDALKKVEKSQSSTQTPSQESPTPGNKTGFSSKLKTALPFMLMLTLGGFLANIVFGLLDHLAPKIAKVKNTFQTQKTPLAQIPPTAKEKIIKETPKKVPAPPVKNEPAKEPTPKFVLNGLFSSRGQSYALINNHVLKEGDSINGAIIKRISPNGVDIESSSESIHLSNH